MENKRILYGVLAGVLLAGLLGLYQINDLTGRITQLEENITNYQNMIAIKTVEVKALDDQIETLQSTLSSVSATIVNLQDALESSQSNSSDLKAQTRELISTITRLEDQITLLDDAVKLIGREETEHLLCAYTEVSMELEDLQREYDELIQDYNSLLATE